MILDIGKFPEGTFMATTHDGARFLWYFHSLFTLCPHMRKLFAYGKNSAHGKNQKQKKVVGKKKKEKKTSPKKKERVPFCQEKKKLPL